MKRFRFLLMFTMLFIGIGSFAQTVVEFVAGVDKGQLTQFSEKGRSGNDVVEKGGITMSCTNATFGSDKYRASIYYEYVDIPGRNTFYSQTLSFKSEKKDIASIEFVDGENLYKLNCDGFDQNSGKWTGRTKNVDFNIPAAIEKPCVIASFSKVIVTLYDREPTTLSFDQPVVYNYIEQQINTVPAPTLKSRDVTLTGLPLTYESNNTAVADVITEGGVSSIAPKTEGVAVITCRYLGNEQYEPSSEAKFTLNVVNGKNIFHESFNSISGTGGNDGNFDYTSWDDKMNAYKLDNSGWEAQGVEFLGSWVYNASQCVRVETGASIATPALDKLSGDALLIFRAAQNRDEKTNVNLSVSGGGSLEQESVTLNGKEFAEYAVLVKDATPETKITLSCNTGGSFYLDDVKVERAIVLDATADNSKVLMDNSAMADGATVNVMVERSLSSKCWNTFCMPFNVKKEDMTSVFGENTYVVAFDHFDAAENTVCFKQADEIAAGTPCMVWPGTDLTSIMARNVTPTDKVHNIMSNGVSFKGVYNPTTISYDDVFLDPENQLDTPDETEGSNRICGFNAYFSGFTDISSARMTIDGNFNSITTVDSGKNAAGDSIYTIDGRYIGTSTRNLAKGIYLVGGKKMVVK